MPAVALLGLFIKSLGEIVFAGEGALYLFFYLITYILALICSLLVTIFNFIKKRDSQEILRTIRTVKLLHLPAHIIIYFIIALMSLGAVHILDTVFVFLDFAIVFLTGLVGLGGIIRGYCEKRLSLHIAIFHGFLQFVFIVDIVSSTFVYEEVKFAVEKQGQGVGW
jgi:hypothetical protein